ncbi:hypothetical protein CFY87_01000 [Actinobacillus seminis]|uniref:Uncharacterized protein n=1 Tax=Actinobacillus seminis TaxID=722 RepID=A0A263HGK6_9PAST|nr:hypothetical protein CFY87_01000 [Actinobacillus seminis]SUU34690.1 Uncharacterised protein [Actinobacillus seminis]
MRIDAVVYFKYSLDLNSHVIRADGNKIYSHLCSYIFQCFFSAVYILINQRSNLMNNNSKKCKCFLERALIKQWTVNARYNEI